MKSNIVKSLVGLSVVFLVNACGDVGTNANDIKPDFGSNVILPENQ